MAMFTQCWPDTSTLSHVYADQTSTFYMSKVLQRELMFNPFMPPSHWATISHDAKDHAMFWKFAWTWLNVAESWPEFCLFMLLVRSHCVYNAFPTRLCQALADDTTILPRHCRFHYGHSSQGTFLLNFLIVVRSLSNVMGVSPQTQQQHCCKSTAAAAF